MVPQRSVQTSFSFFLHHFLFLFFILQLQHSAVAVARVLVPRAGPPASSFTVPVGFAAQSDNVPAAYYITVKIGNKLFPLHLDTGAGAPWVLSTLLPKGQYSNDKLYEYKHEVCDDDFIGMSFGDDTVVEGYETVERMTLVENTQDGSGFAFDESTFVATEKIEPGDVLCLHTPIAGNFGLSWQELSWMRIVFEDKKINPIFTIDLQPSGTSTLTISQTKSQISDSVTWFSLDKSTDLTEENWVLTTGGAGVSSYLVDSGASAVELPASLVNDYFDKAKYPKYKRVEIKEYTYHLVDCAQKLNEFEFKLGNIDVKISGDDLMGTVATNYPGFCQTWLVGYDPPADGGDQPFYQLGLPFINQVKVHFDLDGERKLGIEPRSSS